MKVVDTERIQFSYKLFFACLLEFFGFKTYSQDLREFPYSP